MPVLFTAKNIKMLDGSPNYFAIEDIGDAAGEDFEILLRETMDYASQQGIPSVSITLNQEQASNERFNGLLKHAGFHKHDIQYFYQRRLDSLEERKPDFDVHPIEKVGQDCFLNAWARAAEGSLNAGSSISIEKRFEGMATELGPGYQKSCLTVYKSGVPIGVTLPHIEPGTNDEGRLFYFGLTPEYRGKGLATSVHRYSLQYLKELGAAYYIGATGQKNVPMQQVFQKNGCRNFDTKITYRLRKNK